MVVIKKLDVIKKTKAEAITEKVGNSLSCRFAAIEIFSIIKEDLKSAHSTIEETL